MSRLVLPLISMIATVAAGFLLVRKAVAWGFIDLPDERKIHILPTPRTGGLAMVMGAGATFFLGRGLGWIQGPNLPWQTWLSGAGFILVGALDDRYSFDPRQKFPIFLTLSAFAAWPWTLVIKAHGLSWLPQAWNASPVTLIFFAAILTGYFMAVPNAVNIEDAINGYMGGFTFIILAALSLRGTDTRLFLGALLGFLAFNWPKASHFMGDAGSFGCGFIIAESILHGDALNTPSLAIIMTLPISLDVAMGIIRRYRLGTSLFSADRSTCPHHMLKLMNGRTWLASPALWAVATLFVISSTRPVLALLLTFSYSAMLIFFNRLDLRKPVLPDPC